MRVVAAALVAVALLTTTPLIVAAQPGADPFPGIQVRDNSDRLELPYPGDDGSTRWRAGQTHTHLAPHGPVAIEQLEPIYAALGLSFVVVTPHEGHGSIPASTGGLTVIPGAELDANVPDRSAHIVSIGAALTQPRNATPQGALDAVNDAGALTVLAHPGARTHTAGAPSWRVDDVTRLDGIGGIEVYNHQTGLWGANTPSAFIHWFAALSEGHRVWAFAVDDAHASDELPVEALVGHGYVVVRSSSGTAADLVAAMARGHHVAVISAPGGPPSVWPALVEARGSVLTVAAAQDRPARAIELFGSSGELLHRVEGSRFDHTVAGDEGALVAVLHGSDGSTVVLQPAWAVEEQPSIPEEDGANESTAPLAVLLGVLATVAAARVVVKLRRG